MIGPQVRRHWSVVAGPNSGPAHPFFRAGGGYRVIKSFRDYDGDVHEIGENWTFLASSFLPHEDGASWFVSLDGEHEWHIRLQWRPDQQAQVLEHLSEYFEATTAG